MSEAADRYADEMTAKARTARSWFATHPEAKADARMLRGKDLTREQIRLFLHTEYGFPFRDEKSIDPALDDG